MPRTTAHCCALAASPNARAAHFAAPQPHVDDRLAETMGRNWSGLAHRGISALDPPALRFG
jgi:hypothetical protein